MFKIDNDGLNTQTFEAISVNVSPKEKILKPSKGEVITMKQFNELMQEMNKQYIEQQNGSISRKID